MSKDLFGNEIVEELTEENIQKIACLSPFDFTNSINAHINIMTEENEKDYQPWMVNRALSYFPDTLGAANLVNSLYHLENNLQYLLLLNIIRPKKRFSKWAKKVPSDTIELVKNAYGYSQKKAEIACSLLSPTQIEQLKNKNNKGGLKHEINNRGSG